MAPQAAFAHKLAVVGGDEDVDGAARLQERLDDCRHVAIPAPQPVVVGGAAHAKRRARGIVENVHAVRRMGAMGSVAGVVDALVDEDEAALLLGGDFANPLHEQVVVELVELGLIALLGLDAHRVLRAARGVQKLRVLNRQEPALEPLPVREIEQVMAILLRLDGQVGHPQETSGRCRTSPFRRRCRSST